MAVPAAGARQALACVVGEARASVQASTAAAVLEMLARGRKEAQALKVADGGQLPTGGSSRLHGVVLRDAVRSSFGEDVPARCAVQYAVSRVDSDGPPGGHGFPRLRASWHSTCCRAHRSAASYQLVAGAPHARVEPGLLLPPVLPSGPSP